MMLFFLRYFRALVWGVIISVSISQWVRGDERPNIVWIVVEDQSRHYGFNGEALVDTPNIDRLAGEGAVFTSAAVTGPICSIARSALITGMHQTSIGAHNHRSGRGSLKIYLPGYVELIPELLRRQGYYTSLGSIGDITNPKPGKSRLGKSDYNFEWDASIYDAAEWSGRKDGQPFFAQIMLGGGKSRAAAAKDRQIPHVAPEDVSLPPYYPATEALLRDWAWYLDTFTLMDRQVGQILDRLQTEGIAENTVVIFTTDHGVSHARGKQFCYDEGMMVPLAIRAPGRIQPGTVRDDLVSHIDIAATTLYFAGIDCPAWMEARPFFGPSARPREYIVCARDRADESIDHIRAIRTHRFKYIRNGYPSRPHLMPNAYKDNRDNYVALYAARDSGQLNDLQKRLLFSPERPEEELYDLTSDPWELNNLAGDPAYATDLSRMSSLLDEWTRKTVDRGQSPEPIRMYDSDMDVYLNTIASRQPGRLEEIKANIRLMKDWRNSGR